MNGDPLLDLLNRVCPCLDAIGVIYAITGSVASSLHGQPMSSLDVDICLHLSSEQAIRLAALLPKDIYYSRDGLLNAARNGGITNLIDGSSGMKADLSVVPNDPFFDSVFSRRQRIEPAPGVPTLWVVSPEDVILMKLLCRKDTHSQKQWENALSVVRVQGHRLNVSYLRMWAERLSVAGDLGELLRQGGV